MEDRGEIVQNLRALNGEEIELSTPQSRIGKLLYKLNGYEIETETPQSEIEVLFKEYIDNGGGGGGGSSDFSIAHVTLNNTSQDGYYYTVDCYYIYGENMEFGTNDILPDSPLVLDVILYKGEQYMGAWDWDTSIAPVITGDITYDSQENLFIITGDGSISLVGTGQII